MERTRPLNEQPHAPGRRMHSSPSRFLRRDCYRKRISSRQRLLVIDRLLHGLWTYFIPASDLVNRSVGPNCLRQNLSGNPLLSHAGLTKIFSGINDDLFVSTQGPPSFQCRSVLKVQLFQEWPDDFRENLLVGCDFQETAFARLAMK